jgi:hypothetical protein
MNLGSLRSMKRTMSHDLELAAIVHALKMWRHYLMGRKFELRTYHNGLKYLFEQQILNSKQTRWLKSLSEYDFDIKHIRGKENKVANAISRRIHAMHATNISMCKSDLRNIILEAVTSNEHCFRIKEGLQQQNVQHKYGGYKLGENGIVMHKSRVYVPIFYELRKLVLKETHNVPYAGYPSYWKTIAVVRSQYFWLGMKKDVADYIARCMKCERVKDEHRHQQVFSRHYQF